MKMKFKRSEWKRRIDFVRKEYCYGFKFSLTDYHKILNQIMSIYLEREFLKDGLDIISITSKILTKLTMNKPLPFNNEKFALALAITFANDNGIEFYITPLDVDNFVKPLTTTVKNKYDYHAVSKELKLELFSKIIDKVVQKEINHHIKETPIRELIKML